MHSLAESMARLRPPYALRRHQEDALTRLMRATTGDGDNRDGGEGGAGDGDNRDGGEGTDEGSGARRQPARAWVVLPPGAGKTLTGLEAARRLGAPVVVLTPNTAIQGQWVREWESFEPHPEVTDAADAANAASGTSAGAEVGADTAPSVPAGTGRSLDSPVTVLTYQALASFDPDAEVDEEGSERGRRSGHLHRLRPQGRELVEALRRTGAFTLLLDECHHLLDTWGELLAELLRELPDATVVGLTATPPDRLSPAQAELVRELFGPAVQGPSIPAAVREGHLAPYAELCWLTSPTAVETEWLAAEAERFTELTTGLLDPGFASVPFLSWLDERFVTRRGPDGSTLPWSRLARERPELTAAALRFHHAELLALPEGARPHEEHRRSPGADDWVLLLDDWIRHCLRRSGDPRDAEVLEALRAALPSVGHQLTARGVRGGRSPVDRVLARSAAKPHAVREILAAEDAALGDGLRAVVVCDHERATATLPARLSGVLEAQAGSALLVLEELAGDPRTAALDPVLVTGRTVAASPRTAERLLAWCRESAGPEVSRLALFTQPLGASGTDGDADAVDAASGGSGSGRGSGSDPGSGSLVRIAGPPGWNSRRWVEAVTRFFEDGGTHVLIGTRGMLGEGWDARRVNTLIDLTEATTPTAVVQTRGRALRLDPGRPDKVANTWSVVCVAQEHPRGDRDWGRFVRKHDGYLGLTDAGEVMVGVSHVHPELSPYAPPPAGEFHRFNAVMLQRAAAREEVRERWRVGEPYEDELIHTVRVTVPRGRTGRVPASVPAGAHAVPPAVPAAYGVRTTHGPVRTANSAPSGGDRRVATACGTALAGVVGTAASLAASLPGPPSTALGLLAAGTAYTGVRTAAIRRLFKDVTEAPVLVHIAWATADALHRAGLVPRGPEGVSFEPDETGAYRVELDGVPRAASARFATAFDEAVSPLTSPRYVVPRHILPPPGTGAALRALFRRPAQNAVVHHAVPTALGENRRLADLFAAAWNTYVSTGDPLYTRSPEGAGVLAAQAGGSPLEVTTAMRLTWQ
ncbi:DEAD/DEAH box helicase family protein [Streptomyces sp. Amel2xB2]|uniref:DEAD/DEAH box helicase family protein n=1 Tax=Streptomyces sp. Amel2xB2 TaxID=1305829 RepID=UPI001C66048A|nr:DEAD/DEAH box helicase family protein [Streptomyces sp. Amel2xB2]